MSSPGPVITALTAAHWGQVERIYAAGIAGGDATFEAATPSWAEFDSAKLAAHRLVALGEAGETDPRRDPVLGWVAVSAVSARSAYAGVVEHSVYVDPQARGRGVGRALLGALIRSTEAAGIWTVQGGIFAENTASLALHQTAGFRVVGTRERVGRMRVGPRAGQWRDVVLVERRSPVVG